jgi:hypothetical protein
VVRKSVNANQTVTAQTTDHATITIVTLLIKARKTAEISTVHGVTSRDVTILVFFIVFT